jgi:hypothetical protein
MSKERKIVFTVSQFKELVETPMLAVALVRVINDDMTLTTAQAIPVAKALLKQYELFKEGQVIDFGTHGVVSSEHLSHDQKAAVADGTATVIKMEDEKKKKD